ncbi:hypothetical protein [Bacillus altitudinis]|uniref:hypothetical protein n=1 Tax=Bacillus altitudinis TaxID=293387 RepID=UPI002100D2B6|nr:hypothetical protein [Bacillus altitudinis]UTV34861.1 hypothetical protein NM966_19905 [Bacillus altitudinis]
MELKLNQQELIEAILIHIYAKTGMHLSQSDVDVLFKFRTNESIPETTVQIFK